jgi:hypothetical protein
LRRTRKKTETPRTARTSPKLTHSIPSKDANEIAFTGMLVDGTVMGSGPGPGSEMDSLISRKVNAKNETAETMAPIAAIQ